MRSRSAIAFFVFGLAMLLTGTEPRTGNGAPAPPATQQGASVAP